MQEFNGNFCGDEQFPDEMGINGRVLLCRGMFVMLAQNLSVSNGLVNGSSGIIIGFLQVENSSDCDNFQYVLVRFKDSKMKHL